MTHKIISSHFSKDEQTTNIYKTTTVVLTNLQDCGSVKIQTTVVLYGGNNDGC